MFFTDIDLATILGVNRQNINVIRKSHNKREKKDVPSAYMFYSAAGKWLKKNMDILAKEKILDNDIVEIASMPALKEIGIIEFIQNKSSFLEKLQGVIPQEKINTIARLNQDAYEFLLWKVANTYGSIFENVKAKTRRRSKKDETVGVKK